VNLRLWRPALVFVGLTLGAAVVGLRWGDAALVGLVAAVVTAIAAMVGAGETDPWPRYRPPDQSGTRRDVMALTWSFIGREGRVSEFAVRRVRLDATRRLAARGVVVPGGLGATTRTSPHVSDEVRAQARALLGDRAWFILTTPGGTMPSLVDIAHCVEVVERLEPPAPSAPAAPPTRGLP
jgi:hypothetical protein